jgi:hypothetical protein
MCRCLGAHRRFFSSVCCANPLCDLWYGVHLCWSCSILVGHPKSQKIQRHWQPTIPTQGMHYQWTHWRYTVLRRSITFTPAGLNCNFKFPYNVNLLLLFIVNKFVTIHVIRYCPIYDISIKICNLVPRALRCILGTSFAAWMSLNVLINA